MMLVSHVMLLELDEDSSGESNMGASRCHSKAGVDLKITAERDHLSAHGSPRSHVAATAQPENIMPPILQVETISIQGGPLLKDQNKLRQSKSRSWHINYLSLRDSVSLVRQAIRLLRAAHSGNG